jgi:hypothetical protein
MLISTTTTTTTTTKKINKYLTVMNLCKVYMIVFLDAQTFFYHSVLESIYFMSRMSIESKNQIVVGNLIYTFK